MSKRRDQDYLGDIREAIQRIAAYTADMTYERFMEDPKTQDAVRSEPGEVVCRTVETACSTLLERRTALVATPTQ